MPRLYNAILILLLALSASSALGQYIVVNPSQLVFASTQGDQLPAALNFTITNADPCNTLNWSITDDALWLDENPLSGSGNFQQIAAAVNTTTIAPMVYSGLITVSGNASNSPQYVRVTYVVLESDRGDANCDGNVNIGDAVYLINYVFKGGPPPQCQ